MLSLILIVPALLPSVLGHYVPPTVAETNTTHLLKRGPSVYPAQDVSGPTPLAAWVTTYNQKKAAGLIPSFPTSSVVAAGVSYPAGTNSGPTGGCSWTVSHCFGPADVVDAPTGYFGVAFDDGPQLAGPTLYNFLKSQNQKATHFMIGSRIIDNPGIFKQAVDNGDQIAVHTWSHPHMTAMTDMQVLGELGWTLQIIYDQSGLIPAFWRPPYGDVDNRVRAIAKEVFGLLTVIWNTDTSDWCLYENGSNGCGSNGPQNDAGLDRTIQTLLKGPKTPGLILLEHEINSRTVGGFIRNYPTILSQGWLPRAIADIWSVNWYSNARNNTSGVYGNMTVGQGAVTHSAVPTIPLTTVAPQSTAPLINTPTGIGKLVTEIATVYAPAVTAASQKTSDVSRMGVNSLLVGMIGMTGSLIFML